MPRRRTIRRARGRGSIYWTADKGWVGQVTIAGRRIKRGGPTPEAVAARLDELLDGAAAGLRPDGTTLTVGAMVDAAVAAKEGRVSSSTLEHDRGMARHLHRLFGHHRAAELSPMVIEAQLATLDVSPNYAGRIKGLLAQSYRWAQRHELLDRNPARVAHSPVGVSRPVTDRKPLGLDEARALLEASRDERLGGIIWLGLLCGLRPGESRALAVDDVDLVAATVTVRRQMTNDGRIGPAKTEGSVRSLRMPDELVEQLAGHLDRLEAEREVMAGAWPESDLLFPSEAGTPVGSANLRRVLDRCARRAGITTTVTPYLLRRTHGSIAHAAGASLKTVADILGHADTRTTELHYVRRVEQVVEESRQVGSALFGQ